MRRFFGEKKGNEIIILEDEFFHLKKVLRMSECDKLIACINDDNDYYCTIKSILKDRCICDIDDIQENKSNPKKHITLFQMLPKKDYFDKIVAKSIELGVSDLYFFKSEYSANMPFKKERLFSQIMTACKQCERSKLISANDILSFDKMLEKLSKFDCVIFAYEKCKEYYDFAKISSFDNIALIIGAEGGFSEKEATEICQRKVIATSLGSRILRCDTASLTLLTLVNYFTKN